jgi:hypothetical protein
MEDIIDIVVTETTNLIEITSQASDEVVDVSIVDNREDVTLNVTPTVVEININSLDGEFLIGTGTTNYVPKFTSSATIGNSNIQDSGTLITLGSNSYVNGSLGIGSSSLTGISLNIAKNLTGATASTQVFAQPVIQSDVTGTAVIYNAFPSTQSTAFTLTNLYYYQANQSTIGAGSGVTTQIGFRVASSLTGATNNFAFRSELAAATNTWNLYMNGTANNYLAGALGIGATSLTGFSLKVSKNITGATTAYGIYHNAFVQSDVTGTVYSNYSLSQTAAAAFTLGTYVHYMAEQGTIGAGSAITNQYGFFAQSNLTGATNDYGFYGNLASATNVWNLYMAGTANNYLAGSLGIGATFLTGWNLRMQKAITGTTQSFGMEIGSTINSDVTTQAVIYGTAITTQAATFTLSALYHYIANATTFGAGSTVTNQFGFYVQNTLIGATNNYGFYGNIPSGTNRWNLYMGGTANNYLAGSLGIGTTSLSGLAGNLNMAIAISGGTQAAAINVSSVVQSDVTSAGYYFRAVNSTAAASFTTSNLVSYLASQGTIGAGSTVSSQKGFWANASLVGGTTNTAFQSSIPVSGLNNWNFYADGTAPNYMAGSLYIGTTIANSSNVRVSQTITGASTWYGIRNDGRVLSDVTSKVENYTSFSSTLATSFTLGTYSHYSAQQGTIGAGSNITNQIGYEVQSSLIGGTNNYGFYGNIASGTNRWNLYMAGTANNYLAGGLGIGTTSFAGSPLAMVWTSTGATSINAVQANITAQSDVTTRLSLITTAASTVAASFTLDQLQHFRAQQGTFGAGSTVTNQIGFLVNSTLIGATNNYGFYGDLAASTGRWNLYMNGTAQNYLAGALSIGVTTADASALFQVDSTTKGVLFPRMTTTQKNAISSPATGLVVFDTTLGKLCVFATTWQTITSL